MIAALRDSRTDPRYFETDDWLRHLGVSEHMFAQVNREMTEEGARVGQADAGA